MLTLFADVLTVQAAIYRDTIASPYTLHLNEHATHHCPSEQ